MSNGFVQVRGDTYPVRDRLKALGGAWDRGLRCWMVPESRAEEARLLTGDWGPVPDGWVDYVAGEGYGGRKWAVGTVRMAGEPGLRYMSDDTCWVVVACKHEYIREDGMSFGVGEESGYLYTTRYRPATDAEAAPVRARIEAARRGHAAANRAKTIHQEIEATGEYRWDGTSEERRSFSLQGERLALPGQGRNLHGGGWWFMIEPERIWAVTNNGMDGDDWSRNNVRTGGAGAIGRCVPYSDDLAARIRDAVAAAGAGEVEA